MTPLEIRVTQKQHLTVLLELKQANQNAVVKDLDTKLKAAIAVMEAEDVSYCEKIIGIKAI